MVDGGDAGSRGVASGRVDGDDVPPYVYWEGFVGLVSSHCVVRDDLLLGIANVEDILCAPRLVLYIIDRGQLQFVWRYSIDEARCISKRGLLRNDMILD